MNGVFRSECTDLSLGLQLTGDEANRNDPVPFGCVQQPLAGTLPGGLVFELHSIEASQSVTNVRLVVDR
jgi:hypothetical protein